MHEGKISGAFLLIQSIGQVHYAKARWPGFHQGMGAIPLLAKPLDWETSVKANSAASVHWSMQTTGSDACQNNAKQLGKFG